VKPQILHIVPSLDRAGAEKQLALLVANLPRDEFEVHVCALTRGGELAADLKRAGIPLTILGKRWKADPTCYWKLRKLIARLKPRIVHTWMFTPGVYGRIAGRQLGVPHLIHSERCADRWKAGWQWAFDRRLAANTDRIVANSPGVRDFGVEHGLPAEKYLVIPNGIAPAPASDVTRAELLKELGLPPEVPLIGAVGRLWPQKRVRDLIWAMELLHIIQPRVHFLIIGDGPERHALERYVRTIEGTSYMHFLGHRSDVPRILPHLDLFWQGSGYEGMPNAVMEAMAAGVPVIATDIPGTRDLVVSGETGYLYPIRGRKEFCKKSDELLADLATARQMGAAGQRRILERFPLEPMVAAHARLYRELLG
jgi:glycosyltransferase involved in cell wall biosynthesis